MTLVYHIQKGENLPTPLMSCCSLAWAPMMGVLAEMVERGHVRSRPACSYDRRNNLIYEVTDEGGRLLVEAQKSGIYKLMEDINRRKLK